MASRKASSEGIALLSMYNDEEDEEIDEMDEDERNNNSNDGGVEEEEEEDMMTITDNNKVNSESTTTPSIIQFENSLPRTDSTPQLETIATPLPTPQHQMLISTKSSPLDVQRTRKGTLTIVDYAHDETAMSPEPEEGEIMTGGRVVFGDELQTVDGTPSERNTPGTVQILSPGVQTTPPQSTEQPELSQSDNSTTMKNEETVAVSVEVQKDVDELERFLPPPPKTKCSEALQEKINKFLDLKRAGKSFNAEVRNRKDYRNPDFLLHAVRYQDIDQIGSCFSKDVFDPHGYDKSDYYDELEADMKREMERKDNERKKSQKMEFVTGGTQPGVAAVGPKINMQLPAVAGVPTVAASGLHSHSTVTDSGARESRLNKKSKWDKVDGDKRNPLHSAKQDTVSTTGPHASMLSAANAGAGYSAFAYLKLESLSLQIRKLHYPGRLTGILPSSLEPISPATILRQKHFWRRRRS